MATAVTPQHQPLPASTDADPVVLAVAARFVVRTETVPQGVRPRDVAAYLEGIVEEHSPLPLEHISWGYLGTKLTPKSREVLIYAAAKEQIFGIGRRMVPRRPTLPSFAALYGLRVKEPTWVFLAESGCLSAVLMRPDSSIPARVLSRYLQTQDEAALWAARSHLIADNKPAQGETILPGLVRVEAIQYAKPGRKIGFTLRRLVNQGEVWESWQQTQLAPLPAIEAADLRERALLNAQKDEERSGRSMRLAVLALVVGVLAIIGLEATLYSRSAVAQELSEQAKKQEDAVKQLQQMEAMTKALEATLQRRSRPFELLASASLKRPDTIYFRSLSYAGADQLRLTGEADNIQIVNTYVTALREDGHWANIELSDVRTEANGGASFQLLLKPHANSVFTPAAPQQPPAAPADPATNPDGSGTPPAATVSVSRNTADGTAGHAATNSTTANGGANAS